MSGPPEGFTVNKAVLSSDGCIQWATVRPVYARFEPQLDITAYELAQILPFVMGRSMWEKDWEALGVVQRHLRRTDGGAT